MKYWFFDRAGYVSSVTADEGVVTMTNGIISRTFDTRRGMTLSFKNLFTGVEYCAAPCREGFLKLNGVCCGLGGEAAGFIPSGFEILDETTREIEWTPKPYASEINPWPAKGKSLILHFSSSENLPAELQGIRVRLRCDIFDGIPVIARKLYIESPDGTVRLNTAFTDILKIGEDKKKLFYAEADYRKGGLSYEWKDGFFRAAFDIGPDTNISPDRPFEGMRMFELLHSYPYYEQRMVEIRAMYRIVAPWCCEAPLFLHLISDKSDELRAAVDSVAGVGFDMIIQSFGSGVNMESDDEGYLARVKSDYDYAHSKGIEIGGYTLAIIKDYSPVRDDWATDGDGEKISRCLASRWSVGYWNSIMNFIEKTGCDMIEIDGPYHFYFCDPSGKSDKIRAEHLHHGKADSRFTQWSMSTRDMLKRMRAHNVYVNAPDWLFLCGSNKTGIGYEEIGWSQPREEQLLLSRVYNYNGTFNTNPAMGWSFVPIEQYQGGGDAAAFEPLDEHLAQYEWAIAEAFISGVQPCFRGHRLYDTERTRAVVAKWAAIYKKYRRLLNGYTVHFLPPEIDREKPNRALGIDAIMQVNPACGPDRALFGVFNQTDREITQTLLLPLYYTGLTALDAPPCPAPRSHPAGVYVPAFGEYPPGKPTEEKDDTPAAYPEARLTGESVEILPEGDPQRAFKAPLDTNGNASVTLTTPAMSFAWYTIRA